MARLALFAVLSLLVAGLISACGSSTKEPAALAPAEALFYGEVNLAPPGGQKAAIDALARKFPGSGNAGQRLSALLEEGFREEDAKISFERDVKPWLGDRAAFFAGSPRRGGSGDTPAAALVATKDEDKALAAVQKEEGQGTEAEYEGVKYRRFADEDNAATTLDGYLVLSNELGLKALVDASKNGDRGLEASDRFKKALEGQPKDRLGFAYVDVRSAFDAVPPAQAQFLAPFRRAFRDPVVATAAARPDALDIITTTPESQLAVLGLAGVGSQGSDLLGKLPGDSVFASGGPELGRRLGAAVDLAASSFGGSAIIEQGLRQRTGLDLQRDVLGWMGDYGIFVRGRDRRSLGGALVVETRDPAATRRAIGGFRRILRRERGVRIGRLGIRGADAGLTVTGGDLSAPVNVFLKSNRFVVAYGNDAANRAVNPRDTVAEESTFSQVTGSLGGGYTASTYASVPAALRLAEGLGATKDAGYRRAKPYLTVLGALVGAAKPAGGGKLESKFRLTVPG